MIFMIDQGTDFVYAQVFGYGIIPNIGKLLGMVNVNESTCVTYIYNF